MAARATVLGAGLVWAAWPDLELLREALLAVCTERNADVFLQYRIQQRLGDQSPATTVAAMFDLSEG